uniref:hypothetical protein n=1 Tax=Halomonas campaniensis TaxID=213554 RepID=UPI003563E835
ETIAVVARFAHRPEDRAALLLHAEMIVRGAREGLLEVEDLRVAEDRYRTAMQLCSATGDVPPCPSGHTEPRHL